MRPEAGRVDRPCVVAVLRTMEDRYVAQLEAVDPRVRVVRVTGDRPAAGFVSTSGDEVAFANTNGVRRHTAYTTASITGMVR
ncbi:MAG: hypothetical protein NVSMB32_13160 [Actinomycetota bacterium]